VEDQDYGQFIRSVKISTGIDLSQYKETQMKRRLTTLRNKRGFDTFAEYYQAIMKDRALMNEFLDRLTINVSEFWRNPNRWEVLEKKLLPELIRQRGPRLKCWSAACSTGEEPYTLAMILAELGVLAQCQIIASDIDEGALDKAKQGVYPEQSVRDVPPHYLATYFTAEGGSYAVSSTLKKAVRFEKKNLLADPFDTEFDLIICRNVIIYFTEEAKLELYRKFSRSLRPGGLLFVGSTEQIFSPGNFQLEQADLFFYRKKSGAFPGSEGIYV
jgi:chemotaxis protein methyltransferase CheR